MNHAQLVLLGLAFACVFHIAAHILLGEIIMSDLEILALFVGALAFFALGFALFDARKRKAKDKR